MMHLRLNLMIAGTMASLFLLAQLQFVTLKTSCRSRESECRTNLKAFVMAQRAFLAEKDRFGTTFAEIGFRPEASSRYLYTMDATRLAATFVPTAERAWKVKWALVPARAAGDVPVGSETAVCVGNLDADEEVDVWSVSIVPRVAQSGEAIPAGVPWHDRIDRERDKPERGRTEW